jgi:hypothetical protein
MVNNKHLTLQEMMAGLDHILSAPKDEGRLEMIVRRPQVDERQMLDEAELDSNEGLVGDSWKIRRSSRTDDGSAHPDMQLNIMNSRVAALVAQDKSRWQLAGDQLYIDMDITFENLPPGTRLAIGTAIIEVTAEPHTGCNKFSSRFGQDAIRFVNSPERKNLRLRGLNAKIIQNGTIHVGDTIKKI